MKPQPLVLSVPQPCSENWDAMSPTGANRYCSSCQTAVIDFTGYTDADLVRFFATNRQGVCGRYLPGQLNRPLNIPYQPHSRLYRLAIACSLTLLFAPALHSYGQAKPPMAAHADTTKPHHDKLKHFMGKPKSVIRRDRVTFSKRSDTVIAPKLNTIVGFSTSPRMEDTVKRAPLISGKK